MSSVERADWVRYCNSNSNPHIGCGLELGSVSDQTLRASGLELGSVSDQTLRASGLELGSVSDQTLRASGLELGVGVRPNPQG